jgi:hypothetical protein
MNLCTHQCTVPIMINYSTLQEYWEIISSIIFPFWHSEFNNTKSDFLYQQVLVCDIPLRNTSEKQRKGSTHTLLYFIVSYSISYCNMFWLVSKAIISCIKNTYRMNAYIHTVTSSAIHVTEISLYRNNTL